MKMEEMTSSGNHFIAEEQLVVDNVLTGWIHLQLGMEVVQRHTATEKYTTVGIHVVKERHRMEEEHFELRRYTMAWKQAMTKSHLVVIKHPEHEHRPSKDLQNKE